MERCRAGMAQFQCTPCILVHEDTLDRDDVGAILDDDLADRGEDLPETVRKAAVHAVDDAAGNVRRLVARKVEHAESRLPGAGVNAKDASRAGQFVSQSCSSTSSLMSALL